MKGTLRCSNEEFAYFIDNHKDIKKTAESNEIMTESYIMIDPYGRFYQNVSDSTKDYLYSNSLLDIDAKEAFNQITFKKQKFENRY